MSEEVEYHFEGSARMKRRQKALARREQIVEAAVRLFAQHGFDGTSTRQIAQEVNITEGLIFHYFPTKADLLASVLETRHSFLGALRTTLEHEHDLACLRRRMTRPMAVRFGRGRIPSSCHPCPPTRSADPPVQPSTAGPQPMRAH